MRNRKQTFPMLTVLVLGSVLLCGCGGKEGADAKTDNAATTTPADSSKAGATSGPSLGNPGGSNGSKDK